MSLMSELAPSTRASRVDSFTCRPSLWQICIIRFEICCLVGFLSRHTTEVSDSCSECIVANEWFQRLCSWSDLSLMAGLRHAP